MIYFVTQKAEQYRISISSKIFDDIIVLDESEGKALYYKMFGKKKVQAFDIEATGLDPYLLTPLLYGLGDNRNQFMFDWTVNVDDIFKHIVKHNIVVLGHNLKYDIKVVMVHNKVQLVKVYDTMIAEQRLWMKSGYEWGLDKLVERYCKKYIIKATRNEFIDANIDTFKITSSHLYYLKGDLVDLFTIRKKQQEYMKKFKMEFLIYGVEFPLITIIAEAEVEGFDFNIERWKEIVKEDKDEKFRTELALDNEVRRLRELKAKEFEELSPDFTHGALNPKITLGGIKYNKIREHNPAYDIFLGDGTTTELNIFGEPMSHRDVSRVKTKVKFNPNNINYSSPKELVHIFAALGEPLINKLEQYSVPKLNSKGKLVGYVNDYTFQEDFLDKYLLAKPDSIMKDFITLKIKHSKLETAINSFGDNFLKKVNPVSGKIHTVFRQCFAVTGRMQSGGGKKEPEKFNAQNIPASNWEGKLDVRRRHCFTVDTEKYSVLTADYSGAELIVMASHAQDFRLLELSKGDMHSHFATVCWRAIFAFRANNIYKIINKGVSGINATLREEYRKYVDLAKEYTVTKKDKKERTEFKPMAFGTIYGMYPKKAGATLNISKDEGAVVIRTIEKELPATFAMVKQASIDAERQGYVILNNRTNSRAWFPNLIRQIKGEISMDTHFMDISKDKSDARNIRIQGTQADFVKESTVVMWKYFRKHKIDAKFLSWVHDEEVVRNPIELDGHSDKWRELNSKNPIQLPSFHTKGKYYDNIVEVEKEIMEVVANRYLHNVVISAEVSVEPYWTKE